MINNAPAIHDYYDFEVSLCDIEPRIWRRFLLPRSATFYDLHKAIQDASRWKDYHLFEFRTSTDLNAPLIAGIPDEEEHSPAPDAKKERLESFFKSQAGLGCVYCYDFGDDWQLEVKLSAAVALPYKFKRALLDGARAFPPEDCGGIGGYERCVEFRKTGYEEYDEGTLGLWLGDWQPEAFDLAKVKGRFDR